MKVFADLHHGALYHSLRILFEKRLGWELYRPTGKDWLNEDFWTYSKSEGVKNQYLEIPECAVLKDGYYEIPDKFHGATDKCLTFEQFKNTEIDIVVASVREHEETYRRLVDMYKPKAKLIRQAGNIHDIIDPEICPNIMASALLDNVPKDINVVTYHQEFDLQTFNYRDPTKEKKISNFMNCVPDSRDFYLYPAYEKHLHEYEWKMFGIQGKDGILDTAEQVAEEMRKSMFVWHVKFGGDGFGHVIHNVAAVGRPMITRKQYYDDKLGGLLLEHGKTCIDIDQGSYEENIKLIRQMSEPENHKKMCEAMKKRFDEVVNFDEEFIYIKKFLENLL